MAVLKKSSLSRHAARFLARRPRREVERLLPKRAIAFKKSQGRILKASNLWQEWEIRLLGRLPDRDVARRTGRTCRAAASKRRQLGFLRRPPRSAAPWTPEHLRLLGKFPDKEVARKLNRN